MSVAESIDKKLTEYLASPRPMLIGGNWVSASSERTIPVYNPATEGILGHVSEGGSEEIDMAVAAARRAFEAPAWRRMVPSERSALMWKLADLIDKNSDELATLETLDQGLPITENKKYMLPGMSETLRYYAGWCTKLYGETLDVSIPDMRPAHKMSNLGPAYHAYTQKEPVGVVGVIIPWNYPLLMAVDKFSMAIAAGCTLVVKPSEETPLSTLRLGELVLEAGFPPGVFNVVTGYGHIAGAALAAHLDVDKIAFTGSTDVGRKIVVAAMGNMKKLTLELGGKSPSIVMKDADLERVIPGIAGGIFPNAGQVCFAGTRIYVEKTNFDAVVEGVAALTSKIHLAPGIDPKSEMGPLVSAKQQSSVCGYIQSGLDEGAELVTGGGKFGEKGYFVKPTILVNTTREMKVVREEIFGPVLTVMPFTDISEIEPFANDTAYGLAASVWTQDIGDAHRIAAQIKAGTVWINGYGLLDLGMPFGGYKQSGWGREGGRHGVEQYLETKTVIAAL